MQPHLPLQFGLSGELFGVSLSMLAGKAVAFVAGLLVTLLIGRVVLIPILLRVLKARGFTEALRGLTKSVANALVLFAAIAVAFMAAGFPSFLTAAATLSGALALAVGFAAQDLVGNFVAGVFIIKDKPFEVGDYIEWSGNGGIVREIELRVTKLDTFGNEQLTVPNRDLASAVVKNPVANETLRVDYDFGIEYDADIEDARRCIVEEGAAVDGVLVDPEPSAPVTALGDSAVVLNGRIWIDPRETSAGGTRAAFVEAVKTRFDAEGIGMPYPHTELVGTIGVESSGTVPADD